jgi:hypothetical protein
VIQPDGSVLYTPDDGFSGVDTFTYTATDECRSDDHTDVTVTVTPIGVDDSDSTPAGEPLTIDVLDNDPAGPSLTVTEVTQGANGTVVIDPAGTVTYTPNDGFSGIDTFTYTATDEDGQTITQTVTITVTPDGRDDSATTTSGTSVSIDVLANDPTGPSLVVQSVTQASNGTVTIESDGQVRYWPNPGFAGVDTFTYTACDAAGQCVTQTVTVTVDAPDVRPAIQVDKTVVLGELGSNTCPGRPLLAVDTGATVTYCFVVTNVGDTLLDELKVNDRTLQVRQNRMTLVSGSLPLEPGASIVYSLTRKAQESIDNTVEVSARPVTCSSPCLPIPGTSPVDDSDTARVRTRAWDVGVTKTGEVSADRSTTTWTLSVRNDGPGSAPGPITLVDVLPGSLAPVEANGSGWSCDISGQTVTCVRDRRMAVGEQSSVELVTRNLTTGTVTNVASVTVRGDVNLSNQQDSATIDIPTGSLPITGSDIRLFLVLASILLGVGSVLVRLRRSRRASTA